MICERIISYRIENVLSQLVFWKKDGATVRFRSLIVEGYGAEWMFGEAVRLSVQRRMYAYASDGVEAHRK